MQGWYGIDLDGTLAEVYWGRDGVKFDPAKIGAPIPRMIAAVQQLLDAGEKVKIFTARVYCPPRPENLHDTIATENWIARKNEAESARIAINVFTHEHFGQVLESTCVKDFGMIACWDDRSKQVVPNTGIFLEEVVAELQDLLVRQAQAQRPLSVDAAQPAPADSNVVSTTQELSSESTVIKTGEGFAEGVGEVAGGAAGTGHGDPDVAETTGSPREGE